MQIKVLVLEESKLDAVGYWRYYMPFMVLRKLYPGVFDFKFKKAGLGFDDIANADIVFHSRFDKPEILDFIKNAKLDGIGTRFVADLDDDLLDLPPAHPLSAAFDFKRQANVRRALDLADELWTSTPYLANKYGGVCIPNSIFAEMLPKEPAPDRGRLMWRGHMIQNHDLELAGRKQYKALRDKVNSWSWIGYAPTFDGWERYIRLPQKADDVAKIFDSKKVLGETPVIIHPPVMHTTAYLRLLSMEKYNYVWKPLHDCGFNKAKSNIALIEATITGGVCITNFAGKQGWENAVPDYVPYKDACKVWEAAKEQITKEYNLITAAHMRAQRMFAMLGVTQNNTANVDAR